MKRIWTLVLAVVLLIAAMAPAAVAEEDDIYAKLEEIGVYDGEPITINVYTQLANYSGIQAHWRPSPLPGRRSANQACLFFSSSLYILKSSSVMFSSMYLRISSSEGSCRRYLLTKRFCESPSMAYCTVVSP